jgi:hypothetical protein
MLHVFDSWEQALVLWVAILYLCVKMVVTCWIAAFIKEVLMRTVAKGSQQRLNMILFVACTTIACIGATHNAWESSFDSLSSYFGFAPPTMQFDNIAFLDEFAAALTMLLLNCCFWGLIEISTGSRCAIFVMFLAYVNRDIKGLTYLKWLPPFGFSL